MKTGRAARGPERRVALAGVPNSGKSTLFNVLTGGNAVTGNYAGVTVDVLTGRGRRELFPETEVLITDLPGLWSLRAFTPEEGAAAAALRSGGFDAAVVVIDALAPERGIFLALRLRALGIPLTAAVNLCDALRARGGEADGAKLSRLLGFPAVPVSAARGEGIAGLCRTITAQLGEDQKKTAAAGTSEPPFDTGGAMGRLYAGLCALTGGRADAVCALLEGDDGALKRSPVSPEALRACRKAVQSFCDPAFTDAYEAFVCLRHRRAREIAARAFVLPGAGPPPLTAAADRILLGRHTAVPCFCLICAAVLLLTFGPAGKRASEWAGGCFSALCLSLRNGCGRLFPSGLPGWVTGLVFDGFLTGAGSVLDFLPRVLLLFFCMSLLEDSGVMARAAYVGDGLLRRAGLPGRAFLPLLTGFGCTVPAALAARTVAPERERRLTLRLLPLMSCSARMPVYTVFCAAFFPGKEAAVCAGLYLCGVFSCPCRGAAVPPSFSRKRRNVSGPLGASGLPPPPPAGRVEFFASALLGLSRPGVRHGGAVLLRGVVSGGLRPRVYSRVRTGKFPACRSGPGNLSRFRSHGLRHTRGLRRPDLRSVRQGGCGRYLIRPVGRQDAVGAVHAPVRGGLSVLRAAVFPLCRGTLGPWPGVGLPAAGAGARPVPLRPGLSVLLRRIRAGRAFIRLKKVDRSPEKKHNYLTVCPTSPATAGSGRKTVISIRIAGLCSAARRAACVRRKYERVLRITSVEDSCIA